MSAPGEARIAAEVAEFVASNFFVPDRAAIEAGSSLLGQGIIDSTGVLELIDFLEQRFAITIADAEVLPANLDTIANISRFVSGKLRA